MEENQDMPADDISALLAASMVSSSDPTDLSPEDAEWVDSCLAPDAPLPPDSQWSEIGEALLEAIAIRIDEEPASNREIPRVAPELPVEEEESVNEPEESVDELEPEESVDELVKRLKETYIGSEEDTELHGNRFMTREAGDEEDELMGSIRIGLEEEIESHNSIFKVWDLDTAEDEDDEEENELVKQFKKALAKTDVDEELAAGIQDLSL